jgi:branched-chain amino acid transport system permease protein
MSSPFPHRGLAFVSTLLPLLLVVLIPSLLIGVSDSSELMSATTSALIMMILVVGLQLFCGNSGVLAFGHVAFATVGAYVCGILTIPDIAKGAILPNLPTFLANITVSPVVGVLAGGFFAALTAAISFYPLRRLNAQALSIATLSLLLVANVFFTNVRLSSSGGALTRVPVVASIWNVLPWLLGALFVAFVFQQSRLGLRLRASREDEFAAESAGIDIGWTRFAAFVISAGIMGAGGGLYGLSLGSFSADDFFLDISILLFAMMVVGGMRSLTGAVVGTILISAVSYFFGQLQNGLSIGGAILTVPPGTANVSIALCMIFVLLFRREGLMRDRELRLPAIPFVRATKDRRLLARRSE